MRLARGFTLLELAVVLAIVGLLLGTILAPLSTQVQLRQVRQEQGDLAEVRDALLGFAATRGRLPCPDTDFDGLENVATAPPATVCTDTAAVLPFADLGLPPGDAWGRLRLYQVSPEFAWEAIPGTPPVAGVSPLNLLETSGLTVQQRLADKSQVVFGNVVAAVISLGRNGYGGRTVDGDTVPVPAGGTGPDEDENRNDDTVMQTRLRTDGEAAACDDDGTTPGLPFCEFDDLLIWIPESVLFNRLIQAGRLP